MFLSSSYRRVENYGSVFLVSLQTRFRSAVTYRQCFSHLPTGDLYQDITAVYFSPLCRRSVPEHVFFSSLCRRFVPNITIVVFSSQTRFRSAVTYRQCFSHLPTGALKITAVFFWSPCRQFVPNITMVFFSSLCRQFVRSVPEHYDSVFLISFCTRTLRQCFSHLFADAV